MSRPQNVKIIEMPILRMPNPSSKLRLKLMQPLKKLKLLLMVAMVLTEKELKEKVQLLKNRRRKNLNSTRSNSLQSGMKRTPQLKYHLR